MKCLLPLVLLLLVSAGGQAQGVSAQVYRATAEGQQTYRINADEGAVETWDQNYGIDLFAYPVDLDIPLAEDAVTLEFAETEAFALLIEARDGGGVVVLEQHGRRISKTELMSGERAIIDVPGSTCIIRTLGQNPTTEIYITRAYITPRPEYDLRDFGFGESDECHPNAACEPNEPWKNQIRSTVRIRMVLEQGIGWCSGTLVNNTALDGKPYILSAEHCLADFDPLFDMWRFDFNYEAQECDNPGSEPSYQSLTGCALRSKHRDTDFMLLELTQGIPVAFNVYYAGWDRREGVERPKVALVHHPAGDIKKVSRDRNPTVLWDKVINWNEGYSTPALTHLRSRLDEGAFEGGSSGGGLFDEDGYLIGQLHGGSGDCSLNTAYSGALSASWDYGEVTGRLREWLDPVFEDAFILDGMEHPEINNIYAVEGQLNDPFGQPVSNVRLKISMTGAPEILIDADSIGAFNLSQLPRADTVFITPRKQGDPLNGVTATDLLLIKAHLLETNTFDKPYQSLAADATGNGEISVADILILQKMLLGLVQTLPSQDPWIFFPAEVMITNPDTSLLDVQFTAIKVGDINGTADPQN